MSKKSELKNQIRDCELEIESLEQKRMRSQSALLRAVLSNAKPDPTEVEFFRVFSDLIDQQRALLADLNQQLRDLKK